MSQVLINENTLADMADTINEVQENDPPMQYTPAEMVEAVKNFSLKGFIISDSKPIEQDKLWINPIDSLIRYYYQGKWIACSAVFKK